MSFLSGNTKKVSVYGRKAEVRVVNRHSAFTSLENDENDPFGFFKPSQPKPKATYARSRATMLPSQLLSAPTEMDEDSNDNTLESQPATDQSAEYETADSSASFHSACSTKSPAAASKKGATKAISKNGQKKALANKALNNKDQAEVESQTASSPVKAISMSGQDELSVLATPEARKDRTKRVAVDSPQTVRKPLRSKTSASASSSAAALPNESTPPPIQPAGRAPRRAAQAARMAIEDYDFTDRDMTPRRPVPTKSYFVEKARQLAELAVEEEEEERRLAKATSSQADSARNGKASASNMRNTTRKSMAARPRHTTVLGATRSSAIVISDSSMSSANGISDSSFDGQNTSQSSFSLIIPSCDDSYDPPPKKSAAATSKPKQNKRITRRIAADSDEEDNPKNGKEDSDDESDPTAALAAQVADLAVTEEQDATSSDSHLSELLASVSQDMPESFANVIQRLRSHESSSKTTIARRRLEKIGEASYSEVFKIFAPASSAKSDNQQALVLKIIPIADATSSSNNDGGDSDELPYTSSAADVEREIRLMQLVGRESSRTDAFVSLHSAHIVRGAYPAALLQAWDRWDAKRLAKTGEGAENIRPHVLSRRQVYALLVMTDGGMDLESLKVKTWLQGASIFWQVVAGLGEMESKYEFEHRDLHWGNILVQSVPVESSSAPSQPGRRSSSARSRTSTQGEGDKPSWLLDPSLSGVKATIIDFTLSRASTAPAVKGRGKRTETLYYAFDDESLFEGSGDPQFEVYREMRALSKGEWQSYHPGTNTLWLRYLVRKLIDVKCKPCKVPRVVADGNPDAQREAQAYASLQSAAARLEAATEKLLAEATAAKAAKRGPVAGRKSLHPRSRKSVLPTVVSGARKGRATMAVTPLLHQTEEEVADVRSAAELMSLINH